MKRKEKTNQMREMKEAQMIIYPNNGKKDQTNRMRIITFSLLFFSLNKKNGYNIFIFEFDLFKGGYIFFR